MRYLAWIAVFSLQLGIFVCGAGIDVCDAADAPSQIKLSSSLADKSHPNTPESTCAAHAAHVFLNQPLIQQMAEVRHIALITSLVDLTLSEIPHRIEQPPKLSHS